MIIIIVRIIITMIIENAYTDVSFNTTVKFVLSLYVRLGQ